MNVRFNEFVADGGSAITEGAVLERVRRNSDLVVDPHILNGGYIYDVASCKDLAEIHIEYMTLARTARVPILTFTDTWRFSQRAIDASRFKGRTVNEDNARFLNGLRGSFGEGTPIFVGGLVGPSADAYKPGEGLDRYSAREFHRPQVRALASGEVDFLHLATAPNVEEALGVADVMAETDLPYMISFVIRRSGIVLDGTPLGLAIERIKASVARGPQDFPSTAFTLRFWKQRWRLSMRPTVTPSVAF